MHGQTTPKFPLFVFLHVTVIIVTNPRVSRYIKYNAKGLLFLKILAEFCRGNPAVFIKTFKPISHISAKHNHIYFSLSMTTCFVPLSPICQAERRCKITGSRNVEQRMLRHLQLRRYWALSFVLWQKVE